MTRKTISVAAGILGLVLALVMGRIAATDPELSPLVILVLWPTAIFGIGTNAAPTFSIGSAFLITLMYGGNILLYGAVGYWLAGIYKRN